MTITYLKDDDLLKVEASEIVSFSNNLVDYLNFKIDATITCGTTITGTLNTTDIIDNSQNFYVEDHILYIKPAFFGLTTFKDGIYKLEITLIGTSSQTVIKNCTFVDISIKCKLSAYLGFIVEENKSLSTLEKIYTSAHIFHYALLNGSNCGCNCTEMCTVYNNLIDILENNPVTTDCGC